MTVENTHAETVAARVAALTSWHADWSRLRVAVLGLGVTGFSVADTLVELGARVRVVYGAPDPDRERLLDVIGSERFAASDDAAQLADLVAFDPELVVVSPGYRPDHPLTTWAAENGVTVWGDIELGWRLRDKTDRIADWICITGTNGKTTTTQLTAHMLAAGGLRVTPAGNIGTPILDALRDPQGYDALVVELSSFQLERLGQISPYASACLNFADDHLDWHGSAEAYWAAKAKVYDGTQVACVYNRADAATERMVEEADVVEGARAISFGLDTPPPSGFGIVEGILIDRGFHAERRGEAFELVTVDELNERDLAAPHMVQNVLAAAALARSRGVEPAEIARAILSFQPDPHRTQRLGEHAGAHWIDDSKATNAHAADASLRALTDVVWIVGGLLKGVDIEQLVATHAHRLRGAVVIGVDRAPVLAALRAHLGERPIAEIDASDAVMAAAVAAAVSIAQPGDTVLLSPAAASMDQFESYSDRGRQFQAAVTELG
ncbi:UDP-N-acetylmuramoyl-L-alanine--D-glutamate ligase [Leucobacter chromiireducens]|uniref:UDP-N-acetylmuramoylalanine--D-glutamate ligase n=1 Tax=Leucobacter chromiireducens subsp. chromiireducens TaxID=660067 RepID=A0ABS1SRJ8_9MICO|nr:UDP-N-acetylmuramoyl-L-alanine--D-glutamate ligase [Leucobacter chromiireducens]MBL3690778.1 UDP-N-acetylmuramoyl-L-alanine--D-glutamate ligase [Leucobacter chromiireducens subsp. chromiireducens]